MDKAKIYHAKLVNIKKEMTVLHEKSAELKVQLSIIFYFLCIK